MCIGINIHYLILFRRSSSAGEFNLEEENFAQRDHHIIVEVLISSWYALLANTDLICYIVVFINQVRYWIDMPLRIYLISFPILGGQCQSHFAAAAHYGLFVGHIVSAASH